MMANINIDNIIILNDYAEVKGGAAKVAIDSAYGIAEAGYNVAFIYATGDACKKLIHPNITLYCLEQYTFLENKNRHQAAINGIWNKAVFRKVRNILKNFNNARSIVHIHSWVKALSISAIYAVVKSKFPNVTTLHDYFSICPNGGMFNYISSKVCQLKPMSISCMLSNCDSRSYKYKVWRIIRQFFYKTAGMPYGMKNFITVSSFSEKILKNFLPLNSKIWQVPNPISIPKELPSLPSLSTYYTFVGRLSAEKGLVLLASLKFLPSSRIRFIGVGDLENYLKNRLPDAEFLGWQPENKVVKYLSNSRALLFLSNWYETQGLVVLEAAALGIPAIVASDTAATDYVDNNITGVIFEKGNIDSLEEKIMLLENKLYANDLGMHAYQKFWEDPPSISKHVNSLLKCYRNVIKDNWLAK